MTYFPLQKTLFLFGVVAGMVTALQFGSLVIGVGTAVLMTVVGLLWPRDEMPTLSFCFLHQGIFIIVVVYYRQITDAYPGGGLLGDVDGAVYLSAIGLLSTALGVRAAMPSSRRLMNEASDVEKRKHGYDMQRIFWVVIALFSVSWTVELLPRSIMFNAAQAIQAALAMRYAFLLLLLLVCFRERKGYNYAVIAFGFVLLPELIGSMSRFKFLFFMALLALLSQWKPWSRSERDKAKNSRVLALSVAMAVLILALGLVWTGGMKGAWRGALRSGQVSGTPIEKIESFGEYLSGSVRRFSLADAGRELSSRVSSGIAYFSYVLETVPERVPHEGGALTMRAVRHVTMPRILFPEKPDLGGDSWLVRKYTGLWVAGDETGTSVGLGYMPELYIDFGVPGMFVALFCLGMLLGLMYRGLKKAAPSRDMFVTVGAALFLPGFTDLDSHLTKLVGGMLQTFIIFVVLLVTLGPWLHRFLLARPVVQRSLQPRLSEDPGTF